jgi:hypothetical protein
MWVDVNLVLESTDRTSLQPGAWVNVIGYTCSSPSIDQARSSKYTRYKSGAAVLQAILIWNAGPVRAEDYEKVLQEQRNTQQKIKYGCDSQAIDVRA